MSDLKFSDKNTERQLIAGFHELEGDGWRWTTHRFAVVLAVPVGNPTQGAVLEVHLYLPDSQIQSLGPITLNADVDDLELPSEKYAKGGGYIYTRTIPPDLLKDALCSVVFTLDKAVWARRADERELGAFVSEISSKRSEPKG